MKTEYVSFKMTYKSFPCVQYKVKYGEKLPILAFAASLLGRLCNAYIPRPIDSIAHSLARVVVFDGTAPEKTGPKDGTKFCEPRKMLQT